MDNIVWVIIASAVTIALGGILLFAGSGTLGDVTDRATGILDLEPEETEGFDDNNQGQNKDPGDTTTPDNDQSDGDAPSGPTGGPGPPDS
jgi:hypothetical protein